MSDRIVWGEGPLSAKLVIIGQCPGRDEIEAGRPFVGGSGRVLDRALQRVGIRRNNCFVTNLVKHFVPPGQPVPQNLIDTDRPHLDRELSLLRQGTTILTLGKEAFDALTGKQLQLRHNRKGAEKNPRAWLRGAPYQLGQWWVIPAVHPSFIMRTGFIESPLFEVDCDRARRFSEGQRPPSELHFDSPTDSQVREYVGECVRAGECGLDIETPETAVDDDELDPTIETPIDLIGLSCRIGESIGIRSDQFHLLRELFEPQVARARVICWTHNGGAFDFYHLGKRVQFEGVIRADTMLGMHLLWPHLTNKDAATCFSIFCDIPYYKNTRKLDPTFYDTIGNCRDTYGALWAGQRILREMRRFPNMESLFWHHMMGITDLLNEWRVQGINTDADKAARMLIMLSKGLEQYEQWWQQNLPFTLWSSPKQLVELFRQKGLPIYKRKRPGKEGGPPKFTETCDDDALEIYATKYKSQIARVVQLMRSLKHAGDFLDVAKEDHHIHPRFKAAGQVGGRIQAVDPDLQNVPEEISGVYPRTIYIPDRPDQLFGVSDFSQIEYRLYVTQAQDKTGIEQIESGDYIYGIFYEEIFKERFFQPGKQRQKAFIDSNVPPWKLLVAKSWPLGFIYGRGVPDPTGLPINKGDCKRIFDGFHRDHPRIGLFHTNLTLFASKNGYLLSPFGRMRRFPNPQGQRNEILAFPGQTVAVDVLIRNALLPLPQMLRLRFGGRVLGSVHDSVLWCARSSQIEEAADAIDKQMSQPLPELGGLSIPVETKVGLSWGEVMRLEKFASERDKIIAARSAAQVYPDPVGARQQ